MVPRCLAPTSSLLIVHTPAPMAERSFQKRRLPDPNVQTGDRVPPHNLDAERGLIASVIIDGGDTLQQCLQERLMPEHFFSPAHQDIFRAAIELSQRNVGIDEITLVEQLRRDGHLENVGGPAYVNELSSLVASSANSRHWLTIVREKFFIRQLIATSVATVEKAHAHAEGIDQLLDSVEQAFFRISESRIAESVQAIDRPIGEAMDLVERIIRDRSSAQGQPTGFDDLDSLTFGFHPGQMVVVAARPGMGKTSIALNFIEAALFPKRHDAKPARTLLFSLEMPSRELALRLLCSRARVNLGKLRSAHPDAQAQRDLADAATEYKGKPLLIDDTGGQTILEIRAKCRRAHSRDPLDLIVIDYIQLINGLDASLPREQQIAEVSRSIKAMAKEFGVPIIALAQLNRKSEDEARQPRMSDLRESGSIEQDADIVLLIAKASAADRKAIEAEAEVPNANGMFLRELIVAKNRNGPTGDIPLYFNAALTRFETPAREHPQS